MPAALAAAARKDAARIQGGIVHGFIFSCQQHRVDERAGEPARHATSGLNKALNRLSSGFRINMSGDDAAGLAVANRYRSDVAIISQGIRNANDGLSELQIKDGALNNISNLEPWREVLSLVSHVALSL